MSETTLENTKPVRDPRNLFGSGRPRRPSTWTGQTARQRHTAELIEKFTLTHGRSPDVVEKATIANVSAMMAKSNARHGVSAEQLVRLSNSIDRLVARLGLAPKPAATKPAHIPMRDRTYGAGREAFEEHLRQRAGGAAGKTPGDP